MRGFKVTRLPWPLEGYQLPSCGEKSGEIANEVDCINGQCTATVSVDARIEWS